MCSLLVLTWIVLSVYIRYNKKEIITKIADAVHKKIEGEIIIGNVSADFLQTFPFVSVHLYNVFVRDPNWAMHQHDFLKATDIYIKADLFSLFSGSPAISKIIIENGVVDYYTSQEGVDNFIRKADTKPGKKTAIPDLLFKNVRMVLHNEFKNKLHDVLLHRMAFHVDEKGEEKIMHVNLNAFVNRLAFNREKGAYLERKSLTGKFRLLFNQQKELVLKQVKVDIDKHPFSLNGIFYLKGENKQFALQVETRKIPFRQLTSILTEAIRRKTDSIEVDKPIDIKASLGGLMLYRSIPLVNIDLAVEHTTIGTPAGQFNDCSFTASLVNEMEKSKPRLDGNSRLTINHFKGKWEKIPITSRQIEISNLQKPFLKCDLQAAFPLKDINDITGSSTIRFDAGSGRFNIRYAGPVTPADTIPPLMNGYIQITDAVINYTPRHFKLTNCDGRLVFKEHDLFIQKLNASAGGSRLLMNGTVANFLSLVDVNPEQLVLDWNIYASTLNVEDFTGYVGRQVVKPPARKSGKRKITRIADNIDKMLKDGVANISLKADKLIYKRFQATGANAAITLLTDKIILDNALLHHAGGTIGFNGSLVQGVNNKLAMKARLQQIDIPGIFYAFNNFGQDAITDQNMKGLLEADIRFNAVISDKIQVHDNSMLGEIRFSVKNGELNNFAPVMKIGETAFKKRDFSNMRFAELKDKLYVNGTAIRMEKMEIRSNVIKLFVEGIYDPKNGTDMSIQVPLTNISKDDHEILKNKGRTGLNIRLRAKTGDDGNLKISWDPFNKAGKEREKMDALQKPG